MDILLLAFFVLLIISLIFYCAPRKYVTSKPIKSNDDIKLLKNAIIILGLSLNKEVKFYEFSERVGVYTDDYSKLPVSNAEYSQLKNTIRMLFDYFNLEIINEGEKITKKKIDDKK